MVRVKICGITNVEDALSCSQSGADALGFIFYKRSPRYISPQRAKKIMENIGPFISRVGVFVNEDRARVNDIASYLNLDILQFHGRESAAYCRYFSKTFKVIKVFFPPELSDKEYTGVSAYLFDIRIENKETGLTLDDSFLKKIKAIKHKKTILSGGITPANVSKLIKKAQPYAVDVASGVEIFPGKKDKKLVKKLIYKVKNINYQGL
ncbi:MAG: hypothetical protein B1H08_02290 [Candidatus Omnitrophica bacterium 4484_171]|nr:MAG: hypothetical protein B1H08_02290 [Candidatus Omnitrophica bacterium 4484_171]